MKTKEDFLKRVQSYSPEELRWSSIRIFCGTG
jgi:hypothetical protein